MRNTLVPIPMLLALSGGVVFGASQGHDRLPAATQGLLDEYPGLRAEHVGSSVQAIYGVPMTAADTPDRAAQWWIEDHSAALGVGDVELRLVRSNAVGTTQRFTVFVYQQFIDDVPVEMSAVRLLVLNGVPNQVVYVGARLAQRPADGYAADSVDGASALGSVQATPKYAHLGEWSDPELAVYYGEGLGETQRSVRAWKFMGTHPIRSEYESYTFFVNAGDGELVYVRNEVYNIDVEGHVDGMATPGVFPDTASNPAVQTSMESVHVEIKSAQPVTLGVDETATVTASGGPRPGDYSWSSSDPSVVEIRRSSDGSATIIANAAGTATVSVTYTCQSGATATDRVE
ncbi:MAG: Ig-like domain-containing protein, partial [Planctomycetes bacterium]|nr:Ig-like domain-containing protein [Planctomycetota bacterium]